MGRALWTLSTYLSRSVQIHIWFLHVHSNEFCHICHGIFCLTFFFFFFFLLPCNIFFSLFFFPPSAVVVKQLRSLSLPGSKFLWAIDTFVVWSWSIGVYQFTETCLIKPPVLLLVSLGQTSHRSYPLWQWSVTIHLNNICLTMISSWQTLTSLSVSVRCKNIRNSLS